MEAESVGAKKELQQKVEGIRALNIMPGFLKRTLQGVYVSARCEYFEK